MPSYPSASVKRNWAPGCGCSLRAVSRIPLGQPGTHLLSASISAVQALSRISPSGLQAGAGICKSAWWMALVMEIPTEYDSHGLRVASQATNLWLPRVESQRISLFCPCRCFSAAGPGPACGLDGQRRCWRRGTGAQRSRDRLPGAAAAMVDEPISGSWRAASGVEASWSFAGVLSRRLLVVRMMRACLTSWSRTAPHRCRNARSAAPCCRTERSRGSPDRLAVRASSRTAQLHRPARSQTRRGGAA